LVSAENAAGLLVLVSGSSYVGVGFYLLRKASKVRRGPEFYLGLTFLLLGISYAFSELPYFFYTELLAEKFGYVARILVGAAAVAIALFTWKVFQPDAVWARRFFQIDAVVIAAGLAISALEGDWEGVLPLTYRGFWLDWVGGTAPYVWLSFEAASRYMISCRRVPLGLMDPLVCNRFLLIAVYAVLATVGYFLLIPMYVIYEVTGAWSPMMDLSLGLTEFFSLVILAISFYSPAFYRRWIYGAAGAEGAEGVEDAPTG